MKIQNNVFGKSLDYNTTMLPQETCQTQLYQTHSVLNTILNADTFLTHNLHTKLHQLAIFFNIILLV